eukprot:CAMPEP_0178697120 /NCGR_PEP_ID=MMETSP0699-20121125/9782_1 /TAXON_ID=265572 /ORGANISM="Extubocellulus spinifer, Strain CCMP396" /LENGTH=449 /DNA_ID=CAMNT_0020342989 /DNA_START=103 /DNA_END=1449 /DNA_ORIENTATION=+
MENGRDSPASGMGNADSRPAKRPRIDSEGHQVESSSKNGSTEPTADDHQVAAAAAASPSPTAGLPPELWAIACEFLPYRDVLTTAAVSRAMLRDVMPSVKMLHIAHTAELHVGPTSRFHDVEEVYVYCMLKPLPRDGGNANADPDDGPLKPLTVDGDSAGRIVPFLCRFPKLERAFLGGQITGYDPVGFVSDLIDYDRDDEQGTSTSAGSLALMNHIITAVSGAYRCGALSEKVWISGLSCPRTGVQERRRMQALITLGMIDPDQGEKCPVCIQACRSFPVQSVIDFECEGSSTAAYAQQSGRICSLDVCLPRDVVETIIAQRPGGKDFLSSPNRILQLLSRGSRHVLCNDDGRAFYVVKFGEVPGELEALQEAIEKIGLDRLKRQEVVDAIMRSFAEDDRDPIPPIEQCYLAKSSFDALKSYGLPIHEADFLREDEWEGPPDSRVPNW